MVRVFISTSHISSVYLTLHARHTWKEGYQDILLVDIGRRRKGVVLLIEQASEMHSWTLFKSFSEEVEDRYRFEPGWRKRVIRHWKETPGIRAIYKLLLERYLAKRDQRFRAQLIALLEPYANAATALDIFAHTETYLRTPLMQAFPKAKCEFLEHGQGDYIYILEGGRPLGPLHALFARPFKAFLERRGIDAGWVRPLEVGNDFPRLAADLLQRHALGEPDLGGKDKPVVYVLLESLEMYQVPLTFWGAYIDHVVGSLPDPSKFHFVLKPHPGQSARSMEITEERCRALGLDHVVLRSATYASLAAEIEFARWADRTHHVYCLVSSGCFCLSQLYRVDTIQYHYSTSFMEKWIANAPPQYKRLFEKMKPLIAEVLAERCVPY